MATTEEVFLAQDVGRELERIRYQIRLNAATYKTEAVGSRSTRTQLIAVMKRDADQFQRRLERVRKVVDTVASRTKLLNGLAATNTDPVALRAAYAEMNTLMQTLFDANLVTVQDIDAASDAILNTLAAHDVVIDGPLLPVR